MVKVIQQHFTTARVAPALLEAFLTVASGFNQAETVASRYPEHHRSCLNYHPATNLAEHLAYLGSSVLPFILTL